MSKLTITFQPVAALKPRPNNPRTHSPAQIDQIAVSIKRFGFTNPVLVDDENEIIAGHGRLLGAKQLGIEEVPTVALSHMSEAEIRAYVIADNRLAENAGWDRELLGLELEYLTELELDDLDVTLTGFELPEIDILISDAHAEDDEAGEEEPDPLDDVPDLPPDAITQAGDVWQVGPHRLICGDATEAATFEALLGEDQARMVFTDPPYNVAIDGHVGGKGEIHHREFAMASGEMDAQAFTAFLGKVFAHLATHAADGALHYVCMDWRHMGEVLAAGKSAFSELKNLCVWAKTNGGMGSLYRSQHELVFVFASGKGDSVNNVELGRHGRNRTNVWTYPGANGFGKARKDLALHPTVKPVSLVADAIRDASHRGEIVLDAFAGSGSTLLAAEKTGRRGYGVELDPYYCDLCLRRLCELAGKDAILEATGQSLQEVTEARTPAEPEDRKEAADVA